MPWVNKNKVKRQFESSNVPALVNQLLATVSSAVRISMGSRKNSFILITMTVVGLYWGRISYYEPGLLRLVVFGGRRGMVFLGCCSKEEDRVKYSMMWLKEKVVRSVR